ncbi:MAG TPA: hypothetical protein VFT98_05160 [Myxococcota bacterium]|nr:hypothetical protein [Myxococcota bacterium]
MATRRSRFMKVSDLVLDENWDDWTLATVIRLLAWMRQRWAREKLTSEQAIEALIPAREAMRITRLERPHVALQRLSSLPLAAGLSSASASLEATQGGSSVRLRWPKVAIYQEWCALDTGTSGPDQRPLRRPGSRRTVEEKKKNKSRPTADPASSEFKFATDFLAALVRVNPGFKPPSEAAFAKWVESARLLIAERTDHVARDLARWLFDEKAENPDAAWWRGVVLSLPKFREKYDQLAAKRRVGGTNARPSSAQGKSTSDLAERARAIVRSQRLALVGAAADSDG